MNLRRVLLRPKTLIDYYFAKIALKWRGEGWLKSGQSRIEKVNFSVLDKVTLSFYLFPKLFVFLRLKTRIEYLYFISIFSIQGKTGPDCFIHSISSTCVSVFIPSGPRMHGEVVTQKIGCKKVQ